MSDCWELLVGNLVAATVAECESHEQSESDAEKDAAADRFIRAKDSLLRAVRSIASAPLASQPPQGVVCKYAEEIGLPPHACMDCSYDPLELEARFKKPALAAPPQGASSLLPADWADQVEQRLLTWRQRFVNKSGDQLALDDMMGQESIDDLIDFVCAPLAASPLPAPQEPVGIVQAVGVSGIPRNDSRGVEWLQPVPPGTKLYAAPAPDSTP